MFKKLSFVILVFFVSINCFSQEKGSATLRPHLLASPASFPVLSQVKVSHDLAGLMFADMIHQRDDSLTLYFREIKEKPFTHFFGAMSALDHTVQALKSDGLSYKLVREIISISRRIDLEDVHLYRQRTHFGLHTRFLELRGLQEVRGSRKIILKKCIEEEDDRPWLRNETQYKNSPEKDLQSKYDILAYREAFSDSELEELKQNFISLIDIYNESHSLEDLCRLVKFININHSFGDGHGRLTMVLIQAHLILYEEGRVAFWFLHNPNGLSHEQFINMIRFGQKIAQRISLNYPHNLEREIKRFRAACKIYPGLVQRLFTKHSTNRKTPTTIKNAKLSFQEIFPGVTITQTEVLSKNLRKFIPAIILQDKTGSLEFPLSNIIRECPLETFERLEARVKRLSSSLGRVSTSTLSSIAKKKALK